MNIVSIIHKHSNTVVNVVECPEGMNSDQILDIWSLAEGLGRTRETAIETGRRNYRVDNFGPVIMQRELKFRAGVSEDNIIGFTKDRMVFGVWHQTGQLN